VPPTVQRDDSPIGDTSPNVQALLQKFVNLSKDGSPVECPGRKGKYLPRIGVDNNTIAFHTQGSVVSSTVGRDDDSLDVFTNVGLVLEEILLFLRD
jgi:hypothetical protein